MTVEDDNMPDDYFTDVDFSHALYRNIMLATELVLWILKPVIPLRQTHRPHGILRRIPLGTDVLVDKNGVVTITGGSQTIAAGQNFVVYVTDLPNAYTAQNLGF